MRKAALLLGTVTLTMAIFGCNGKSGKHVMPGAENDKAMATKFLSAIQGGDKKAMYQIANVDQTQVDQCKEKLIHQSKKLSDEQRKDCEKAVEISGEIDFYADKMRKNLQNANVQVQQTTVEDTEQGSRKSLHNVKVTFNKANDAPKDKTGKSIKEMIVPLHQITQNANGVWIQEFKFGPRDDFKVVSYF